MFGLTEREISDFLLKGAVEARQYAGEIADVLEKYESKMEWPSRFSFGANFITSPPRLAPVKIYYANIEKPIKEYGLQKNENGAFCKKEIAEIGMVAGSVVDKRLGGLFDFSHKNGNPLARISKILEDKNVVKVDFN
jgi:hypothetical protein